MRPSTSALSAIAACAFLPVLSNALDNAGWRSQIVYQVMTDRFALTDDATNVECDLSYACGGSWQGIINRLDYIQDMGFTAIWISPVVENINYNSTQSGGSYHGYWAKDIYAINTQFGTAADLVALSDALHNKGMYLMVDVVTNHMAYGSNASEVEYSSFTPFDTESYFHPICTIDYNSDNATNIEQCWEEVDWVSLADLRTEDSDVLDVFTSWITDLVANYTIDGLRIDSAQQVDTAFWVPFVDAAGTYAVGEVFNGDPSYTCPFQEYLPGLLNYPNYYYITDAFSGTVGSIPALVNGINTMKTTCKDTTLLGSFLENQDNPRFPSVTEDLTLAKNAIAFALLYDGIPILYQGQEQHLNGSAVPENREALWQWDYDTSAPLYTFIATINAARNQAIYTSSSFVTYQATPIYSDSVTIAMRKDEMVSVYSGAGADACDYNVTLMSSGTGYSASEVVTDIVSCTDHTTDASGNLNVMISTGLPLVLLPYSKISGSSLCTTTTSTKSSATVCASSVAVVFEDLETTTYGETLYLSGSVPQLGVWNTSLAIEMSASDYTSSNPEWFTTAYFAEGTVVEYKFFKTESSGSITWEDDPNHTYTVPSAATATITDTWQSS